MTAFPDECLLTASTRTGDWSPQPPTEAERRRWDVEWAGDARDVAAAVGAPATFEMTLPAGPYLMEGYYRPGASHPDALVVRLCLSSAFPSTGSTVVSLWGLLSLEEEEAAPNLG